jgi:molybdenum cofactor cytidylyltransferase
LADECLVAHEGEALAQEITQTQEELILILTGSATSDAYDTAPEALRRAGGRVTHFGMPVDPGNLLFFGHLGAQRVIGLPGCARSPASNGADWVLERRICGVDVTSQDIARMGVGGLLKEIPMRGRLRDA